VKNTIFNTEIYNKNVSHITQKNNRKNSSLEKSKQTEQKTYVDIADIFVYNDLFIKSNNENYVEYYKFLEKIQDKISITQEIGYKINIFKYTEKYSPILKINLQVKENFINEFKNSDIMRLLL
jgi:hypothetical protein